MTTHLKFRFQVTRLVQERLNRCAARWESQLLEEMLDEIVQETHFWTLKDLKELLAALIAARENDRPIRLTTRCLKNAYSRARRRQGGQSLSDESFAFVPEADQQNDLCSQVVRLMGPDNPNVDLVFAYVEEGSYSRLARRLGTSRSQAFYKVGLACRVIRNTLRSES